MKNFLWGLVKDIAFWTLTPVLLIALGAGIGWLGTVFAGPVLIPLGVILIAIGVVWLALIWLGLTE